MYRMLTLLGLCSLMLGTLGCKDEGDEEGCKPDATGYIAPACLNVS